MDDQLNLLQLDGQFSISKGYGNDQRAKLFSVGNPHIPKGQDYFLYTVFVSLSWRLTWIGKWRWRPVWSVPQIQRVSSLQRCACQEVPWTICPSNSQKAINRKDPLFCLKNNRYRGRKTLRRPGRELTYWIFSSSRSWDVPISLNLRSWRYLSDPQSH